MNPQGDIRHIDSKEPARYQLDSAWQHRLVRLMRPGVTGSKRYNVVAVRNVVAAVFKIDGFEALPLDALYKIKKTGGNDVRVIHVNGDLLDNRVANLRVSCHGSSQESLPSLPPSGSSSTLPTINQVEMAALMNAIEVDLVSPVHLQPGSIDVSSGSMLAADDQDHLEEVVAEEAPTQKRRLGTRTALNEESLRVKLLRLSAAEPVSWIVGKH